MFSGILQEMTIEDVRRFRPEVVLLGVGSTEPHGPALPYGTDAYQVDALCRRSAELANQKGARVLMYPTLPVGNNVNFKPFPFACRVSVRTLMLMLLDIFQALEEDGIRKIVIADGHGGNTDSIRATIREHIDRTPADRRAFVCMIQQMTSPEAQAVIEHPSDHGGEAETSRMMHLRPDLVREDKLANFPFGKPVIGTLTKGNVFYVRPWHCYVPVSAGGETRKSSAEKGRTILESSAAGLADFLVELSAPPWSPNFPYP